MRSWTSGPRMQLRTPLCSPDVAYRKGYAKPGFQPAGLRRYLGPRTGTCSVSFAYGGYRAGRYGSHGRDALDHLDFRHGGVFREQAAARVGNSYGARRAAKRGVASGLGKTVSIACFWVGCWTAPGNSCEPRSGSHCVSGDAARSFGVNWRCAGYGPARVGSDVDSGATRALD